MRGRGWGRLSLVDQGVHDLVHFNQCLSEGRAVMELEKVLIQHGVARGIVDGGGGNNGGGVSV